MVAVSNDQAKRDDTKVGPAPVSINSGEAVEDTPVPYGGEMVVPDDEPWDYPYFDADRVAKIGRIMREQAEAAEASVAPKAAGGSDAAESS